jgi:hypothetical protein
VCIAYINRSSSRMDQAGFGGGDEQHFLRLSHGHLQTLVKLGS